jgi:hypothetical protein
VQTGGTHVGDMECDWVDEEMEIIEDDLLNEQILALGDFLENTNSNL